MAGKRKRDTPQEVAEISSEAVQGPSKKIRIMIPYTKSPTAEMLQALTPTARQLYLMTKDQAKAAILKCCEQHTPDPTKKNYQSTEEPWAKAEGTPAGCILCKKKITRKASVSFFRLWYNK